MPFKIPVEGIPVGGRQPASAITAVQMLDGRIIEKSRCTEEEWKVWVDKCIAENNYSSTPKSNGQ